MVNLNELARRLSAQASLAIAAGWIWILHGAICFAMTPLAIPTGRGSSVGLVLIMGIGAALFYVGIRTVKGRAEDTLGNGIGSIVVGILENGPPSGIHAGLTLATLHVFAWSLILAGLLALIGRDKYKTWRESTIREASGLRKRIFLSVRCATVAGWIWILHSAFDFLLAIVGVALHRKGGWLVIPISTGLGATFAYVGIRTVCGRAKGMLLSGVGSLFLGLCGVV
jgi:hypothetical protein